MNSQNLDKTTLGLTSHPALVIVDMIRGFTDPQCPLGTHCPEVVSANLQLLQAFRHKGLPIFFTTVVYHHTHQATVFRRKVPALNVLQAESLWVDVDPQLGRRDSEPLIEKQWASAFHKTDLEQQLKSLGVDSIVVTGLTTSGCVRATAVDGLQNELQVVIAEEAVGDRNQQAHSANLFDLNAKYADVQSVSWVLKQLP
ncbi:isochorismatase family protein [Porticoccaceae bacterium]|nr:isochorismatase [Porticoccaceae bacterium]MDC1144339.1 isochorismatase family protein [Porticoccaceae bacterium]MDG2115410.1 isochorismatase family protein [Porticoccaceae bacterium]